MKSFALAVLAFSAAALAEKCTNPSVQATAYTPTDAQVLTHIPYVAEFVLTCANGAADVNLYADLEGQLVPVVRAAEGNNKYQVSWTKEIKAAKTGEHEVKLYDEDGYAAVKRALERGEAADTKPLVTILVNYAGAYKGAYVNTEIIAAALAFLVFYLAYSSRASLLA